MSSSPDRAPSSGETRDGEADTMRHAQSARSPSEGSALSAFMGTEERQRLTFAGLIMRLGEGVDTLDERFARSLAHTLEAHAPHIRLPFIDALELEDVVITLYMDRDMRLVVTGNHIDSHGEVTVRWEEERFPFIAVELIRSAHPTPYTFATLDFSVRGRKGVLTRACGPLPEGQQVAIRALATIGPSTEFRVVALGRELSVPEDRLELL